MSNDPRPETPLTLGGVPISDGLLAIQPSKPKSKARGWYNPGKTPPKPKEPEKPILEQMEDEWKKLAGRDQMLLSAMRRLDEAHYAVSHAQRDIQLRMRFLRNAAVKIIQRRNGVRVIPGFTSASTHRHEVLKMSEQLRKLVQQSGLQVVTDIESSPADTPPTDHAQPNPVPPEENSQP